MAKSTKALLTGRIQKCKTNPSIAHIGLATHGRSIQIGSDYSTLIAHYAVTHLGMNSEIHAIDPQPRREVIDYASRVEYERVENSSISEIDFSQNQRTILFIDSSHITSGSNLTFESEAGFPPHWSRASLAHANRNFHHSQAQ